MIASKTFALAVVPFLVLLAANSACAFVPLQQQQRVHANKPVPSSVESSSTRLNLMLANAVVELQEVVAPLTLAISATALSYQMDKDPDMISEMFFKKTGAVTNMNVVEMEPEVEESLEESEPVVEEEEDVKMEEVEVAPTTTEEEVSEPEEEAVTKKTSVRKRLASVGKVIIAPGRFFVNKIRRNKTSSD